MLQELPILRNALWSSMMHTTLATQKQVIQALLQDAEKFSESDQ